LAEIESFSEDEAPVAHVSSAASTKAESGVVSRLQRVLRRPKGARTANGVSAWTGVTEPLTDSSHSSDSEGPVRTHSQRERKRSSVSSAGSHPARSESEADVPPQGGGSALSDDGQSDVSDEYHSDDSMASDIRARPLVANTLASAARQKACIFKVFDDCRQDVMAIQVM
jgi:hypothetical protein